MNNPTSPPRLQRRILWLQTSTAAAGLLPWLRLAGTACLCLLGTSAAQADVFSNVPEAADYNLVYELAIPQNGAFQGATAVPYSVNNTATAAPGGFDRVAYYLELINAAGTTWVFASMDAFTTAVAQTGLPHATSNNVTFQRSVSNLEVASNVASVKTGSFDRAQIEMWHHSYSAADPNTVFGSSNSLYDWGDTITTASPSGYGSFQIHNTVGRQVVLAYNRWASTNTTIDDVGIGSSTGAQPDWTFAANTSTYTSRKLVVLVRPKRFNVTFNAVPVNQQVTPRNIATNAASVPVNGTETTGGFERAVLKIFRNGLPYGTDLEQTLAYSGGSAPFSFNPSIPAELASYQFELYLKQGANIYLVRKITDITAGDVFLWYGQSNAEAAVRAGSANAYASPWIRTFGMSSDSATVTQAHPFWIQANGDGSREIPAGVGQWALVVGRKIVDTYGIPVAILNGARGGYSMLRLQRDDANLGSLADTTTAPIVYRVYNRLRYRAIQAKVNTAVRAIFYYQGESDANNTAQHMSGFDSLMTDWRVDFPAVEKVYVTQLHVGCSTTRELPALRDAQRLIPDIYDKARVMSTNGITAHTDNCHFPFVGGYETHGLNSFRQVARDLYGAPDAPDIDAPNPARVEIANEAGDRLRIVLRKPGASITVDSAALADFRLNGSSALLLSSAVTAAGIELQYDRPVTGATSLDYLAHIGNAPGWVRNGNGIGLLTFSEPIRSDEPIITLVSPTGTVELTPGSIAPLSATAITPASTIARFEVFIDGILHTAVNSAATVTANWLVPASGKHSILFRATNTAGIRSEASVTVFAGAAPSPGGVSNGLTVWLKPENGIIRDSAGVVTSWRDSSGNGNHSVQSNPIAMPDYSPQRFGVMPGVAFDGDDWLTGAAGMSTGSYTKVVRVMLSDFTQSGNILSSSAASGVRHALFMSASTLPRIWHSTTFVSSSASMSVGQAHLLTATYDSVTKTGTLYLDGSQVGTGTANNNTSDPTYQLGAINGGNFMRGAIGEAIVFNRVLDSTERASVEGYLAAKIQEPANAPLVSYSNWSAANISSPGNSGANDDANRNGIANLIEFALGIDPGQPGNPELLELIMNPGSVTVRYSRPTDRTGITCHLLESPDMVNWTAVTDQAGPAAGGIEERSFSRPISTTSKLFYQLRVVLVP